MIREKNLSEDLWQTRNEVDYFKYQAIKLFEENNLMRKQIHELKIIIENYKFEETCKDKALKNMAVKLSRSKRTESSYHHKKNYSLLI